MTGNVQYDTPGFTMPNRTVEKKPDMVDRFLVRPGLVRDRAVAEKVVIGACLAALVISYVVWQHSGQQGAHQLSPAELQAQVQEMQQAPR